MGWFSDATSPGVSVALDRIERKLDLVLRSLGVEMPEATWEQEARALVAAGRKIEAIKLCRQRTGAGLAEAKAMIDTM